MILISHPIKPQWQLPPDRASFVASNTWCLLSLIHTRTPLPDIQTLWRRILFISKWITHWKRSCVFEILFSVTQFFLLFFSLGVCNCFLYFLIISFFFHSHIVWQFHTAGSHWSSIFFHTVRAEAVPVATLHIINLLPLSAPFSPFEQVLLFRAVEEFFFSKRTAETTRRRANTRDSLLAIFSFKSHSG